ncbi:MAG TPA: Spo0E family sporulation regulatory protein-aspartic acid phosphatase [Firmicutes bacterium]|nr:Spo0E family sporulation regulatory protein-aspartic acid phosphatase [Bacillota bacterium]
MGPFYTKSEAALLSQVELLRERLNRCVDNGVDHRRLSTVLGISSELDILITEYMKHKLAAKRLK